MKNMNTPLRLLSLLLCVMTLLCVFAPAAVFAADNAPISELALSQGDEGMMTLEKNGYTVMGRPLTGDYWLGYKRGGSAVTGLVVSSDNSNSVTVNGIAYQRVGSLGGAGSLYLTRDAGAGSAVLSVHLQSSAEYADQPFLPSTTDAVSAGLFTFEEALEKLPTDSRRDVLTHANAFLTDGGLNADQNSVD